MKTILLPLDLNANMKNLFDYAEPIAAELNAQLLLLHVIKKQSYDNGTFSPHTDVHNRVSQESRIILEQLSRKAILRGIRTRIVIMDGDKAEAILATAQKSNVDMILLSSTNKAENQLSSKILAKADCPILNWQGPEQKRPAKTAVKESSPFMSEEDYSVPALAAA